MLKFQNFVGRNSILRSQIFFAFKSVIPFSKLFFIGLFSKRKSNLLTIKPAIPFILDENSKVHQHGFYLILSDLAKRTHLGS
jgi:hypothetical protein